MVGGFVSQAAAVCYTSSGSYTERNMYDMTHVVAAWVLCIGTWLVWFAEQPRVGVCEPCRALLA